MRESLENDSVARRPLVRGIRTVLTSAALVCLAAYAAGAQTVGGYVEVEHSQSETRIDGAAGGSAETESEMFLQRYNLNYAAMLYPYLQLRLGYLYERLLGEFETDGREIQSLTERLYPSVDLNLSNPVFYAGMGYRRTEQRQNGGATLIRDSYNAGVGLRRREDRPNLDLMYARQINYDRERKNEDNVSDLVSFSTRHTLIDSLDLAYQLSFSETRNNITGFETDALTNTGRASYSRDFFERRVAFSTNYSAAYSEMEASLSSGQGTALVPVPAIQGISGAGPSGSIVLPETPLLETMSSKLLLIDTEDPGAPTPTDINIGYTPLNQNPRSLGLVFANPSDVDMLAVRVNQDISPVATSFVWDVYVSQDRSPVESGPRQWVLWRQSASALFNAFDRVVEITFPAARTQFIKVVVRPLQTPAPAPPVNTGDIAITNVQAFRRFVAASGEEMTQSSFSHTYDLNVRTRLAEAPVLVYHDIYFWIADSGSGGDTSYTVANALIASRRFSTVWSAVARAGVETGHEQESRVASSAAVSVSATPLPALNHSIALNWRKETAGNNMTTGRSIYQSNYAEIYPGISMSIAGGVNASSISESESRTEMRGLVLNAGATIVPHPSTLFSVSRSDTATRQYGNARGESSNRSSSNGISFSFSPFPALHLAGSVSETTSRGTERSTVVAVSASWSPFAGGDLRIGFFYNQQVSSPSEDRSLSAGPSVQWRINPRLTLTGAWSVVKVETVQTTSFSDNFNVNLRWMF